MVVKNDKVKNVLNIEEQQKINGGKSSKYTAQTATAKANKATLYNR